MNYHTDTYPTRMERLLNLHKKMGVWVCRNLLHVHCCNRILIHWGRELAVETTTVEFQSNELLILRLLLQPLYQVKLMMILIWTLLQPIEKMKIVKRHPDILPTEHSIFQIYQ